MEILLRILKRIMKQQTKSTIYFSGSLSVSQPMHESVPSGFGANFRLNFTPHRKHFLFS